MKLFKKWWPWNKKATVTARIVTQPALVAEKANIVDTTIEVGVPYEPIVIDGDKIVGSNYNKIKPQPQLGGGLDQD